MPTRGSTSPAIYIYATCYLVRPFSWYLPHGTYSISSLRTMLLHSLFCGCWCDSELAYIRLHIVIVALTPFSLRALYLVGENVPDDEMDLLFEMADEDGSGKIVFSEFVMLCRALNLQDGF